MVRFLFCLFLGGDGDGHCFTFFSWGITGYNVVCVSGAQHNDLTFVYFVESSPQIFPSPHTATVCFRIYDPFKAFFLDCFIQFTDQLKISDSAKQGGNKA